MGILETVAWLGISGGLLFWLAILVLSVYILRDAIRQNRS